MPRIVLDHLSLTFTLRQSRKTTLKEYLLRGLFLQSANPRVAIHALNDISFTASDGERVGIIGHNGAGKSTLLRVLAGVYPPTGGSISVSGRICSLFEIGLGFEMEANGWDNIAYRGYLQGETPRTLKGKMNEIAEFSELGDFLNVPVRFYSAGMLMRLAFAISTAVEPEVLLIDEVLSVGDLAFQHKAQARMKAMMSKSRLMVMVSHDLNSIQNMCSKVIWLEKGAVRLIGDPVEVCAAYTRSVAPPDAPHPVGAPAPVAAGGAAEPPSEGVAPHAPSAAEEAVQKVAA
jgi:ABC-type polysaccharide/polyol phosphate transport system ATPase subunit